MRHIINAFNLLAVIAIIANAETAHIAITEIIKDPLGREDAIPGGKSHECIELFNYGTAVFSIDSLFLTDGADVDSIVPWNSPLIENGHCITQSSVIPAGGFAIILDKNYSEAPPTSYYAVDSQTVLLTIDDGDLGNGLSADDGIILFKGHRSSLLQFVAGALDSGQEIVITGGKLLLEASLGLAEGASEIPTSILLRPQHFRPSPETSSLGHYEFCARGWLVDWAWGNFDETSLTVACSVACMKAGVTPLRTYWQARGSLADSALTPLRLLPQELPARLYLNVPVNQGEVRLCVQEESASVCRHLDFSEVWVPEHALAITEIAPRASDDYPEWFEVTNRSEIPINLQGWKFGSREQWYTATTQNMVLEPRRYAVLAQDAQKLRAKYPIIEMVLQPPLWRTLNNNSDTLLLLEPWGRVADSVCYDQAWFSQWNSQPIERIFGETKNGAQAEAWVIAVQPSPGQPGASSFWRSATAFNVEIGPIPFTPNGDGRDDLLAIDVMLPADIQSLHITLYSFDGKKMNEFAGLPQPRYFWDGRKENGSAAPAGPFFVAAETKGPRGRLMVRKKGVLWR